MLEYSQDFTFYHQMSLNLPYIFLLFTTRYTERKINYLHQFLSSVVHGSLFLEFDIRLTSNEHRVSTSSSHSTDCSVLQQSTVTEPGFTLVRHMSLSQLSVAVGSLVSIITVTTIAKTTRTVHLTVTDFYCALFKQCRQLGG